MYVAILPRLNKDMNKEVKIVDIPRMGLFYGSINSFSFVIQLTEGRKVKILMISYGYEKICNQTVLRPVRTWYMYDTYYTSE